MSSKVVEADAGIHSLAMAVAVSLLAAVMRHALIPMPLSIVCAVFQPVTSWRLYGMMISLFRHECCGRGPDFYSRTPPSRIRFVGALDPRARLMAYGVAPPFPLDSIYTERYMNLPALNPGGYVNASISNVTGFGKVDYLLAHGSGDDNVHFANSAHLLDMFTTEHIRNYQFRMFTDRCAKHGCRGLVKKKRNELTCRTFCLSPPFLPPPPLLSLSVIIISGRVMRTESCTST